MHHIENTIVNYAPNGLIIDTNLYVLLLVGRADANKVGSDKRTRKYVPEDYILLENTVSRFKRKHTTPNIITETSNLLGAGKRSVVYGVNEALVDDIKNVEEVYLPSSECIGDNLFHSFGVTDVAIKMVSEEHKMLVMTDDFPLYGFLSKINLPVINFNHFRQNYI